MYVSEKKAYSHKINLSVEHAPSKNWLAILTPILQYKDLQIHDQNRLFVRWILEQRQISTKGIRLPTAFSKNTKSSSRDDVFNRDFSSNQKVPDYFSFTTKRGALPTESYTVDYTERNQLVISFGCRLFFPTTLLSQTKR